MFPSVLNSFLQSSGRDFPPPFIDFAVVINDVNLPPLDPGLLRDECFMLMYLTVTKIPDVA